MAWHNRTHIDGAWLGTVAMAAMTAVKHLCLSQVSEMIEKHVIIYMYTHIRKSR